MEIQLRAHHFLCLPGYKGYNYNKEQQTSWDVISKQLRDNPETDIVIVSGKDKLCSKCPNDGSADTNCNEKSVSALDKKVQDILGLVNGQVYKYSEIMKRLKEVMTPQKHEELCGKCQWWQKGLCKDTFAFEKAQAPFMSVTSSGKINPKTLTYLSQVA